jgi:LuxR family transcriptional regulator, maltose regulon positive regulatory protein
VLQTLDRGDLFLVALDDRRQWYRYHHLFADVLRARLSEEPPEFVAGLHRRASDWFAERGETSEAIRHAMAGRHYERAAELVELAIPATLKDRQEATLRDWLEQLPDELVQARPVAQQRLRRGAAGQR